jgi:mannose/fructose/sorbose-specific phosphotransferase system IIA component
MSSLEMLIGKQEDIYAISLNPGDSTDILLEKLKVHTEDVNDNNQLFFMSDIIGGTPFNVCSLLSKDNKNIKVVYGTNLPILLEVVGKRNDVDIDGLADYIMQLSGESIGIGKF